MASAAETGDGIVIAVDFRDFATVVGNAAVQGEGKINWDELIDPDCAQEADTLMEARLVTLGKSCKAIEK